MRKHDFCICENKDADQLGGNCAFFLAKFIEQYIYLLNPQFQASGHPLLPYSLVCVGPGQKPPVMFSRDTAHILMTWLG